MIPDECVVEVNFRFAPDRAEAEAEAFVREFFEGYDVDGHRLRARRAARAGRAGRQGVPGGRRRRGQPQVRLDRRGPVHRLGVPAVNFGPGDPMLAHKQDEYVPIEQIERCERPAAGLAREVDA